MDNDDDLALRKRARRGLVAFFAIVVTFSGLCQGLIIRAGGPIESHLVLALLNMWVPGFAAIVVRSVYREGFRDVSFAFSFSKSGLRSLLIAWLSPVAIGLTAYGLAWRLGLDQFRVPRSYDGQAPAIALMQSIALNLTLGTFVAAISAAGEEVGWRGYMLVRLYDARVRHPMLVSGLIWSAWHLPMILSGQYAAGPHPMLSAILFVVSTTAGACIAARVRLDSGSLWPPVVFHSAWNAVIQATFDGFTVGGNASATTSVWTGESGILVTLTSVIAAWICIRGGWRKMRAPGQELDAAASASLLPA